MRMMHWVNNNHRSVQRKIKTKAPGYKNQSTSFNDSICISSIRRSNSDGKSVVTKVCGCSIVGITTTSNKKGGTFVPGVNISILFT